MVPFLLFTTIVLPIRVASRAWPMTVLRCRGLWSLTRSLATLEQRCTSTPSVTGLAVHPHTKNHLIRWHSGLPPFTELRMPALSPTMSHGNLAAWTVKEGDEVSAGDALAEIETDKATLTWETQDDGIVGKIIVPAGSKDVEVGTIVALLVDDAADVPKLASYAPPPTGVPTALSASMGNAMEVAAATPADTSTSGDDLWHDRLGPAVRVLLETFHLDAERVHHSGPHGILTKGDVLAAAQDGTTHTVHAAHAAPPRPATPPPRPAAASPPPPTSAEAQNAPYVDIPVTQIRRIIASRLCESKQTIPHLYLTADVKLNEVAALRTALKKMGMKVRFVASVCATRYVHPAAARSTRSTQVSVNDFVVQAAARALQEVPAANAFWDSATKEICPFADVDVCVAVATPTGLLTPVVRGADQLSVQGISNTIRDLATRARANKLKPEEFTGGSFTISNLGMYGIDKFFAIINPPQAAIMAVGGASDEVVLGAKGSLGTTSKMTVTLSADHRVYDGNTASAFLAAFRRHIESPGLGVF